MLTNATYQGLSLRTSQTQGVVTTTRQYEASRPLVTNISYNELTGTQMQWERSGNLHSRRSYDGESSSYRYDGVNRLQGVDYPTGNVNLARENSYVYSYDDNGNPLTFAHDFGKMTHSYTAGNQVQQTTHSLREAKKYGYDFRGNRSWEKVWTDSVAMLQDVEDDMWQQEKMYTWNPEDELVGYKIRKRVENGLDSMEYRYHYDENNRKVYAEKRVSDVAEWQPVREYVWDGVQVVYERDLQRGEKTYFAVDGVEHVAEVRVGNDGTKKVLYRLNDHLGGLERLVDAQGKVVGSYRFEPYGKLERYAGSEQSRYAWGAGGKEWVEELGWYEFGRRKYDPQLGGWVSRDPMEQFASLYATGANPLNSVDVDGEAEIKLITSGGISLFGGAHIDVDLIIVNINAGLKKLADVTPGHLGVAFKVLQESMDYVESKVFNAKKPNSEQPIFKFLSVDKGFGGGSLIGIYAGFGCSFSIGAPTDTKFNFILAKNTSKFGVALGGDFQQGNVLPWSLELSYEWLSIGALNGNGLIITKNEFQGYTPEE